MQTQASNAFHNAIMEAGSKDRPPMLAPGNYVQWKSRIKRYIDTKPNHELIHYCLKNPPYKYTWADKYVPVFEAEAVQIILTWIDNDIYFTIDACPNACEMWKEIKSLKQGESINVQDLETNLYWEFGKFTSQDGESLESYYSRFYKMMNDLIRNQCDVTNHQVNVQFLLQLQPEWQRSQQAATRNRGKATINSPSPTYDQEPSMVAKDDEIGTGYDNQRLVNVAGARENVGTPMVQQSRIQCYNCKEFGHVARECQKPKRPKDAAYHKEKMILCKQEEAEFQLNVEQADWRDDTNDELDDQELEAHYMYMAKLQEVTPDVADNSGPIFDTEPLQHVLITDNYNVFTIKSAHPEQSKSVNDTYPIEKDKHNMIIDSLDMSYDRQQIDQDNADDLDNERKLLASLIEKLKREIHDSKNRNKFLETSNKALVDKLKGETEDFKNKNKSLESLNNRFKEANNKLSETNELIYKDLKKFQAELDRRNDVEYASKVEIDCVKAKRDLISYKMESQKSFNAYTQKINDLSQTISEMKKELPAHQDIISILSQQKEDQIKLYKSREDKEIDNVIALENKVKVVDNIVYKTGQSVQKMNMLNPPESDEVIRLGKESRSKLSDLIRTFDYEKLNNLYDLFIPQREKSSTRRYFSKRSVAPAGAIDQIQSKLNFKLLSSKFAQNGTLK
nr:hypothetical protein [Tanacetum cinerariifolium]